MEQQAPTEEVGKSRRAERVKRYILYAVLLIVCALLLYVFVWFGTQLGLLG